VPPERQRLRPRGSRARCGAPCGTAIPHSSFARSPSRDVGTTLDDLPVSPGAADARELDIDAPPEIYAAIVASRTALPRPGCAQLGAARCPVVDLDARFRLLPRACRRVVPTSTTPPKLIEQPSTACRSFPAKVRRLRWYATPAATRRRRCWRSRLLLAAGVHTGTVIVDSIPGSPERPRRHGEDTFVTVQRELMPTACPRLRHSSQDQQELVAMGPTPITFTPAFWLRSPGRSGRFRGIDASQRRPPMSTAIACTGGLRSPRLRVRFVGSQRLARSPRRPIDQHAASIWCPRRSQPWDRRVRRDRNLWWARRRSRANLNLHVSAPIMGGVY